MEEQSMEQASDENDAESAQNLAEANGIFLTGIEYEIGFTIGEKILFNYSNVSQRTKPLAQTANESWVFSIAITCLGTLASAAEIIPFPGPIS